MEKMKTLRQYAKAKKLPLVKHIGNVDDEWVDYALEICDQSIHVEIDDMQIAEDAQTIIGHICMQWLTKNKIKNLRPI